MAASFASAIRIDAGLPVLLGALGIVAFAGTDRWLHPRTWRLSRPSRATATRPLIAVGLVLAYLSIATFTLDAARDYRNSVIHQPSFGSAYPTQHPFWHNAYIGLGYLPNRYAITWSDSVAADLVERAHPNAGYLSPLYESTLRKAYLHLVRIDPGFILNNIWVKSRTIVGSALSRFFLVPILVAIGLAIPRRRRETAVTLLLAAPVMVVGAGSPLMTIPLTQYALGWTGAWGAVWLVGIGWTLAELIAVVRRRSLAGLVKSIRPRPVLAIAAVTALTIALAATASPAPPPSSDDYYSANATGLATAAPGPAHTVDTWRFAGELPHGWHSVSASLIQPDLGQAAQQGMYVRTSSAPNSIALAGPSVLLPAGRYAVAGTGRVFSGGLGLTVRNAAGTPLVRSRYWWSQPGFLNELLDVTFSLPTATRVNLSLDNWTPFPNASGFVVWRLSLLHLLPAARYYAPRATPLTPTSMLARGARLRSWPFEGGTPQGWVPAAGTANGVPNGLEVETGVNPSGAQLRASQLALGPGRYAVVLDGSVEKGGLALEAIDAETGKPLAVSRYWHGQSFPKSGEMAAIWTLRRQTNVEFDIANWAPAPSSSRWIVRRFDLLKLS
ncbi:MAG TPA: hypothetical protein VMI75_19315 [Polyangiaceae bacterium]|nr:hypothetical protein [Polyangiaceae bacterium]